MFDYIYSNYNLTVPEEKDLYHLKKYFVTIHAIVECWKKGNNPSLPGVRLADISGKTTLTITAKNVDSAIQYAYRILPDALQMRFTNTKIGTEITAVRLWLVDAQETDISAHLYSSKTFIET